jgi:hypothetical protein
MNPDHAHRDSGERPGNRLPGMPGNSRFAGAGVMFGIILVTANVVALVAGSDADEFFRLGEIVMFPLVAVVVLIVIVLNTGKLWVVRAFRIIAIVVSAAYSVAIIVDGVAAFSSSGEAGAGMIDAILLILISPLMFLMWRDFRRCRWLDPNSLPHEWEIAAIRDPNSINYRPPKAAPKPDQKPGKAKRRH